MKTVLVISSYVAASRVGANASAFCLRRMGIETVTLPTTLLGRHPGWGNPGGGPVEKMTLADMWASGIAPQSIAFDAVLTGYMANRDQVLFAEAIIQSVKKDNPEAIIMVDPVMGDHGALYVEEIIAQTIKHRLVPLADLITPNVWELGYLTDKPVSTQAEIWAAAKALGQDVVVTSVPDDSNIGAAFISGHQATLASHKQFDKIPHGGGDTLAACLLGHRLLDVDMGTALAQSVASVFEIISAAVDTDAGELPLVRMQDALIDTPALPIQRISL